MEIMKINMSFDGNVKQGYTNIDPFALPNDKPHKLNCHPDNLDILVNDGEAEEILAHNVLNYIENNKLFFVLKSWCKKLSHNGILEIIYVDIVEICRLLTTNQIKENIAISLIYGNQKEFWDFYKSSISIYELKKFFEAEGMIIESAGKLEHLSKIRIRRR